MDVNKPITPALTTANLPKPPIEPPVEGGSRDEFAGIRAKPLFGSDPTTVVSLNPSLSFRWVNRLAKDGLSATQWEARGMRYAAATDAKCPHALFRDGRFIYGDLILMCMPRTDYLGALKHNDETARRRVAHANQLRAGKAMLQEEVNAGKGSAIHKRPGLFQVFTPGQSESGIPEAGPDS
jgi:hypothetical protein